MKYYFYGYEKSKKDCLNNNRVIDFLSFFCYTGFMIEGKYMGDTL